MLSNYFVYDIPASLKDLLRQNMGLDKADFEVRGGEERGGKGGRLPRLPRTRAALLVANPTPSA